MTWGWVQFCREGPKTLVQKYTTMLDIGTAAIDIHKRGVIHRQINPTNLYIDAQRKVFLWNFADALRMTEADDINKDDSSEDLPFEVDSAKYAPCTRPLTPCYC
jgi:serine/threonine protein kinase